MSPSSRPCIAGKPKPDYFTQVSNQVWTGCSQLYRELERRTAARTPTETQLREIADQNRCRRIGAKAAMQGALWHSDDNCLSVDKGAARRRLDLVCAFEMRWDWRAAPKPLMR